MSKLDEFLIFIRELGKLQDEYYRSPDHLKAIILEDISLLISAITPQIEQSDISNST
ncbi:hypothetical protein [Bacillus sp. FSL K6-3431]|uniref:hypothetical protein n=1 Tax=Bacillus sp. FSL K6-3431 TaxID=2921500 RepID=UPI0030F97FDD